MIFPRVPGPAYESELVPQPPIQLEETLQAPDAATVVSNGWSFTDDFQTRPPRWVFPSGVGDDRARPRRSRSGSSRTGDGTRAALGRHRVRLRRQRRRPMDRVSMTRRATPRSPSPSTSLDWPVAPTAGSPEITVELYLRMNTTDKECDVGRIRFVPVFGGANQVILEMLHIGPTGATVVAILGGHRHLRDRHQRGVRPGRSGSPRRRSPTGCSSGSRCSMWPNCSGPCDVALPGTRVGMFMHYVEANIPGSQGPAPASHRSRVRTFTDDMTRPLGAGWIYPTLLAPTRLRPTDRGRRGDAPRAAFSNQYWGQYLAGGMAQWSSELRG